MNKTRKTQLTLVCAVIALLLSSCKNTPSATTPPPTSTAPAQTVELSPPPDTSTLQDKNLGDYFDDRSGVFVVGYDYLSYGSEVLELMFPGATITSDETDYTITDGEETFKLSKQGETEITLKEYVKILDYPARVSYIFNNNYLCRIKFTFSVSDEEIGSAALKLLGAMDAEYETIGKVEKGSPGDLSTDSASFVATWTPEAFFFTYVTTAVLQVSEAPGRLLTLSYGIPVEALDVSNASASNVS